MGKVKERRAMTKNDFVRMAAEKTWRSREAFAAMDLDLMVDLDWELNMISVELDGLGAHDEAAIVRAWIAGESRWLPDRSAARSEWRATFNRLNR